MNHGKRTVAAIAACVLDAGSDQLNLSVDATRVRLKAGEIEELRRLGRAGKLAHVRHLALAGQGLGKKAVALLRDIPALHSLDLSDNGLGGVEALALADSLCRFDTLRNVRLAGNDLSAVSMRVVVQALAKHTEIDSLDLSRTGLGVDGVRAIVDELPASLEWLSLNGNAIGSAGLKLLCSRGPRERLERLLLSSNGIGVAGMRALAAAPWLCLRDLILYDNPLKDAGLLVLCENANHLPLLEVLELDHCGLTDAVFEELLAAVLREPWSATLRHLWVANNCFRNVPADLLSSGDVRQWATYRERLSDTRQLIPLAKVVLLGEGGVGKSHLRRRLFEQQESYYNASEPRTSGVDVAVDTAGMPVNFETVALRLSVWDFGGQRHLHGTHRLFMAGTRTAYVIVCDATRSRAENRLDYWLRFVRHEGSGRCPIVIAVTKCDASAQVNGKSARRLEHLDARILRAEHGIESDAFLDVVEGLGWSGDASPTARNRSWGRHCTAIEWLDRAVRHALWGAPDLSTRYEPAIADLVEWLRGELGASEGEERPYIDRRAFDRACSKHELSDADREQVLRIAHDAGIVHYAGRYAPLRRGEILAERLLNPLWLCGPAYALVAGSDVSAVRGFLTWAEIETILPEHIATPKGKTLWERASFTNADRVLAVDVMCNAGLLFPLIDAGGQRRYFVPDHLDRRGLTEPPSRSCWKRELPWLSESAFGKLLGRLRATLPSDPAAMWRDEITVPCGERAKLCLRLVEHCRRTEAPEGNGYVSTLFAAVAGGLRHEAFHVLNLIDVELRAVLGEPLLGAGAWEPVGRHPGGGQDTAAGCLGSDDSDDVHGQLSVEAEILLETLIQFRERARRRRMPEDEWQAKSDWFDAAGINRRRPDADQLIEQLIRSGRIRVWARGKWRHYRAIDGDDPS
ncbi:MAG: hypothetical protein IPM13_00775 [Phycisphaerales bacterium]|nr:hypothetical protein [Phycisphaerales bacterium]